MKNKVTEFFVNIFQEFFRKMIFWGNIPMTAKSFFQYFLLCFFGLLAVVALLVFWLDPYVYYHKAWGVRQVYDVRSVAIIPGILRHFEYDCVLIGSSMTQNFHIDKINSALKVNCIKATSAGLTGSALNEYLKKATREKKGKLKRVLIGMDYFVLTQDKLKLWEPYHYLYKDILFPPEYFYSTDTLEALWKVIRVNVGYHFSKRLKDKAIYEIMFCNEQGRHKYGRKYIENYVRKMTYYPTGSPAVFCENLERYILEHVRKNPEIRFDFFLPPYSIYLWCVLDEGGQLETFCKNRDRFAAAVSKYPNVYLHDFQTEEKIVCDLDLYKDVTHYAPEVNDIMLAGIASGNFIYDHDSFRKRTQKIKEIVKKFRREFALLRKGIKSEPAEKH